MLVSRGHKKDALLNDYSISEVLLFAKAATSNEQEALMRLLVGMRVASHATAAVFDKYISDMLGKRHKRSSRAEIEKLKALGRTKG